MLYVIDVSDPFTPDTNSYEIPRSAYGVAVKNDTAYVAYGRFDAEKGLLVLDVSDKKNISLIEDIPTDYVPLKLAIDDTLLYVVGGGEIWTLNISDSIATTVSHHPTGYYPLDLCLQKLGDTTIVWVADRDPVWPVALSAVSRFNMADPKNPKLEGRRQFYGDVTDVKVRGDIVYIANERYMQILQFSDSLTLDSLGSYSMAGSAGKIVLIGTNIMISDCGLPLEEKSPGLREVRGISDPNPGDLQIVNVADSTNPTLIGVFHFSGPVTGTVVSRGYAYVLNNTGLGADIRVVDMADEHNPVCVDKYFTNGVGDNAAFVNDTTLALAAGNAGLEIINISDPCTIAFMRRYTTHSYTSDVVVRDGYAFVAIVTAGVKVFDITNPDDVPVASFATQDMAISLRLYKNCLYIADGGAGIQVYDITNPEVPIYKNTFGDFCNGLEIRDNRLYAQDPSGFDIYDIISDSLNPGLLGRYPEGSWNYDITVIDGFVAIADGWNGVQIVNVSDPANPYRAGLYNTPGFAEGVVADSQHVYVADEKGWVMLRHPILTDVDENDPSLPAEYELEQNYPNPFNPLTTIRFSLERRTHVRIKVYDLLGQEVMRLFEGELSAGSYTVQWRGTDSNGNQLASGVYLYSMETGGFTKTKKMVLLK